MKHEGETGHLIISAKKISLPNKSTKQVFFVHYGREKWPNTDKSECGAQFTSVSCEHLC